MTHPRKREGAALFVVLMIVMVGTASAVFSANSVSHEVRGTGFARLQMQTRYAARAGLIAGLEWFDLFGPVVVRDIIQTRGATEGKAFNCTLGGSCYPEPELAGGRLAYRLYPDHFDRLVAEPVGAGFEMDPILQDTSFGPASAHEPLVFVDLYDEHVVSKALAGAAAQGGTKFKYMRTTMTARGHAQVAGGGGDVADADDFGRERNETGANMRAYIISGPFMSSTP